MEFRIRPGKFLPLMILWLLDDHLDTVCNIFHLKSNFFSDVKDWT